ncbi:sensor histidine kinase [Ornithinimicrobium sp. W1679]|uniref:sensor histidine kinase n=2 Tax=Ornithinimicrobium TaxID=125287 RepID=UPI003CF0B692
MRQRLLALIVAVMTVGLLVTGLVNYALGYRSLVERVDAELLQEQSELLLLAQSGPDGDGQPYRDADQLFLTFLQTAVAGEDEALLAVVDGQVVLYSGGERPFDVRHPDIREAVEELAVEEGRARMTTLSSQDTSLRMLVSDVQLPGETREATFVVVIDLGRQSTQVTRQALTYAGLSLAVLSVAALLAHLSLGRLLRPLRDLQQATAETTTEDLSRRVEVESADTEVAELAVRYNDMLDRIEAGVREQRQFLDDAAHELRTPLTIVRGNAELLDTRDAEDVAASRRLILEEVDRMQRLVDDLLMLARSQRPDFLRPAGTDVTQLAVEAMDRITALGPRAWRLDVGAEGVVELDRQRVLQALVQLAANAVKFSGEGSTVELSTAWAPAGSGLGRLAEELGARPAPRYLVLGVSDRGIGIPRESRERVFDRFTRAENAAQTEGSGLGLPIVRVIAEAHGGAVGVESEEGVGSTFRIFLPDLGRPEEGGLEGDGRQAEHRDGVPQGVVSD